MALAHEDGRRRGRWSLSWGTLFCFGSQEEALAEVTTTPWERSRWRKRRTVPVDGDLVGTAADSEVIMRGSGTDEEESRQRKGLLRLAGCCFLDPASARVPGRKRSTMDSSSGRNKQRHLERTESPPRRRRPQSGKNSPSGASQIQAAGGSNSTGSRSRGAEQPRSGPVQTTGKPTEPSKTGAGGVGAFGPVVGLSVVVAVSMAGLLGGRLWAVACVCTWLAALSRLRRREAAAARDADEEVAVGVDSTDQGSEEGRGGINCALCTVLS